MPSDGAAGHVTDASSGSGPCTVDGTEDQSQVRLSTLKPAYSLNCLNLGVLVEFI